VAQININSVSFTLFMQPQEAAAEEIIGELQALFARHNAGAALGARAMFKPTKKFHAVCRGLCSAVENIEKGGWRWIFHATHLSGTRGDF
jgi:hypothetical protein